jgi:hypothetical protein
MTRWEDTPNRHAYCDGEIARLRAERDNLRAVCADAIALAERVLDGELPALRQRAGLEPQP